MSTEVPNSNACRAHEGSIHERSQHWAWCRKKREGWRQWKWKVNPSKVITAHLKRELEIVHWYCIGTPAYYARNSDLDVQSCNFYIFATNHYDCFGGFYFNKTLCRQIKPICVLNLGCDHQFTDIRPEIFRQV